MNKNGGLKFSVSLVGLIGKYKFLLVLRLDSLSATSKATLEFFRYKLSSYHVFFLLCKPDL